MMRKALLFMIVVLAGIVLSGCGMLTVTPQRMQFTLEPSGTLGYQAAGAIAIETRNMRFSNAAGATGLRLTGYQIRYFDDDGNEIQTGVTDVGGSMDTFVPAGIRCDEPDEELGCTILSQGAFIAPGYAVTTTENYQLLDVGVAQRHLDTMEATGMMDIGWYAEFVFSGYTMDTGAPFTTVPYKVHIAPPN
jgi:hypothetical protein